MKDDIHDFGDGTSNPVVGRSLAFDNRISCIAHPVVNASSEIFIINDGSFLAKIF